MKWFNKQSRLVQILLLLIPGVNWITEMVVRWTAFIDKPGLIRLIIAILTIPGLGFILGWLDVIWCLLYKHLIFAGK